MRYQLPYGLFDVVIVFVHLFTTDLTARRKVNSTRSGLLCVLSVPTFHKLYTLRVLKLHFPKEGMKAWKGDSWMFLCCCSGHTQTHISTHMCETLLKITQKRKMRGVLEMKTRTVCYYDVTLS